MSYASSYGGDQTINAGFVTDANNSTSTPLLPNTSFVGDSTNVSQFNQIHLTLKVRPNEVPDGDGTTAKGSLFVEFSPNGTDWDISIPILVKNGLFIPQAYIVVDEFYRVRYLNDGGSSAINALGLVDEVGTPTTQTEFRLNSRLFKTSTKELGRTLDQSISGSDPVTYQKSSIFGKKRDALLERTTGYSNIDVTDSGGLHTSIPWITVFNRATPNDPTLLSGTEPTIDAVLNTEINVIDSGWLPVKEFGGGQFLHIISNTSLTVFLLNASDDLGNNLQGSGNPSIVNLPGFPSTIGAPFFSDYFRIIVMNLSGIPATSYDIRSQGCKVPPAPIYTSLDTPLADFFPAPINRSVTTGRQPDGDYVNTPADGAAYSNSDLLLANQTITSPWIDSDGWNTIKIFIQSDQLSQSQGCLIEFTDDVQEATPTIRGVKRFDFKPSDLEKGFLEFQTPTTLDGFRISYTNGPTDVGLFYIEASLRTNADSIPYNGAGALIVSDYGVEVAQGNISNYKIVTLRGRNPEVDTSAFARDMWAAGISFYFGQPVNFTPAIMEIESRTANNLSVEVEDTALGDGARTVRIYGLRSPTSTEIETEIVTMNHIIPARTVDPWWRVFKSEVVTAGDSGGNLGNIKISAITGGVFDFIPLALSFNNSTTLAGTVPAGKRYILKRVRFGIVRANGSPGSATISIRYREAGGTVFHSIPFDLQTGTSINFTFEGGVVFGPGTDIKATIDDVSDNDTIAEGALEFYEIAI